MQNFISNSAIEWKNKWLHWFISVRFSSYLSKIKWNAMKLVSRHYLILMFSVSTLINTVLQQGFHSKKKFEVNIRNVLSIEIKLSWVNVIECQFFLTFCLKMPWMKPNNACLSTDQSFRFVNRAQFTLWD